ncbi:mannosylglycerate hydrolase [Alkalicoccobacillus murimartini]|uniref:Mannosylglycerate hydrolase n=1 Tax=Alkalicoccobacillus murimartini TaxID=171685 RepID=A0ABT9YFQ8_9BACI|nr:mannosylglycerate hydrolase [Alkalicoccobacillus murimartini]MDQ0206371.1 mannosylglycerate hydrolase [Alkalicoccobacillus murimartini]
MKKTKVHVIPHTHWDREWYFTSSRSTVYLVKHLSEVLDTLETNENFNYYLMDAQTSLIEDYLKYRPEDKERIEALVQAKRLLTGPWYTQTDQLVISQESVTRNLLYGTKYAKELGHSMNIGYVPDSFGQGGNMPQIYKNFGIDRFLFWRGVADNRLKQTEFLWEGDDGTQMLAEQIPFGYYHGGNIPEDDADALPYIEEFIGKLEAKASTKNVYFPNGLDQAPMRLNLPEIIEKFNELDKSREYVLHSPEQFFDELEKDVDNLPVIKGELTEGKHSRLHKSIFSTRADLKQANNEIENFLVNVLEPILSISFSLGNPYPHRELEEIWKLMFENAAHDSIGGCNSDTTNLDVKFRYKLADEKAKNLLDLHMRLVAERIPYQHDLNFTLFNPLPYRRTGVVKVALYIPEENFTVKDYNGNNIPYAITNKVELTDYVLNQTIKLNPSKDIYAPKKVYLAEILLHVTNVNGFGYDSFYLELNDEEANKMIKESPKTEIENEYFKVKLAENNTLTIVDKQSSKEYTNQMIFVENGDDGDSYNYSPPRQDLVSYSTDSELISVNYFTSEVEEHIEFTLKMKVPYDLEGRANQTADRDFVLKTMVALRKSEELIRFEVEVDNQVLSHRLCVQFNTEIASKFSTADQLFGTVTRPVYLPEMEVWEEENWAEAPISIEPMQSFVSLHDQSSVATVFTEGVREYEIVGESYDTIQLTLFRTFSHMGKTDLLYRPGRASGESIVETPDAQLLGKVRATFAYSVKNNTTFDEADIAKTAKEHLSPITCYQFSDFLNGRMIYVYRDEEKSNELSYNLLNYENMDSVISTIKKAEETNELVVRVFNPYVHKTSTIEDELVKNGQFVMLDESTKAEELETLKPYQFSTISIRL